MTFPCFQLFCARVDPTKLIFWQQPPSQPGPEYHIHYRYIWWGGERYIRADVYKCTRYGHWLLMSAIDPHARAVYRAVWQGIRAFARHDDVCFSKRPLARRRL